MNNRDRLKLRKRIETKYDEFYARALVVLKKYNPCNVHKCLAGIVCQEWINNQKPETIHHYTDAKPNTLCCIRCKHHDKTKGCQADKPLACKLWLCHSVRKTRPEVAKQLDKILDDCDKEFSNPYTEGENGGLLARGDRRETINHIIRRLTVGEDLT